jgi:hypothetical protein
MLLFSQSFPPEKKQENAIIKKKGKKNHQGLLFFIQASADFLAISRHPSKVLLPPMKPEA